MQTSRTSRVAERSLWRGNQTRGQKRKAISKCQYKSTSKARQLGKKKMQLSYLNPLSTGETSCNGDSSSCRTLSPELNPALLYLTLVRTNVNDCCLDYFRNRQVDTEAWFNTSYRRPASLQPPPSLLPPACPQLSQLIKAMGSQTTRSHD